MDVARVGVCWIAWAFKRAGGCHGSVFRRCSARSEADAAAQGAESRAAHGHPRRAVGGRCVDESSRVVFRLALWIACEKRFYRLLGLRRVWDRTLDIGDDRPT